MQSLLEGVRYLHERQIVHKDLKPGNVLVSAQYEFKIGDFGLATSFRHHHFSNMFSFVRDRNVVQPDSVDFQYLSGLYEMWDFPSQTNQYENYCGQMGVRASQAGTKIYQPPEVIIESEFFPFVMGMSKPSIIYNKHYPTDNYALGMIFASVCNGLNPISDVVTLLANDEGTGSHWIAVIKGRPTTYNYYLYPRPDVFYGIFEPIFIYLDERLLHIVRSLMKPNYTERSTASGILSSAQFQDLLNEFPPVGQPFFTWNQYTSSNDRPVGQRLAETFETGIFEFNEPPFFDFDRYHRIPETSMFPVGTDSPGVIGAPSPPSPVAVAAPIIGIGQIVAEPE